MLTVLIDLLTTASAIGAVAALTATGIAVLPWRAVEADEAGRALADAARAPARLLLPDPAPLLR